jgi:hypothetical protein
MSFRHTFHYIVVTFTKKLKIQLIFIEMLLPSFLKQLWAKKYSHMQFNVQ